jgi:hypothetical protein
VAHGEEGRYRGEKEMSEIVKCDLCGGLYNQRHLASHKRLSHGKKDYFTATVADERDAVNVILALYKRLSAEARKDVLDRLAAGVKSR